ncbi:CWF19-like protein 2 [Dendronephthya gigantea]|uniref:CWF19-like protein 2 n=1 Tax=Dendronephthya gigantea TaxID=151771 RepID=UPI0010698067|nr:CWF19-like protein 2 [Dendronephthya gigantea]
MADLVNFVSKSDLDARKAQRREERKAVLLKAKEQYERRERDLEERKKKGEDVWMLPSVDSRLSPKNSDEDEHVKKKKHKQDKKKKKKKKRQKVLSNTMYI